MNSQQLNRILEIITIEDLKEENIFGIIGRMEMLLEFFKENKEFNSHIPFLKTYSLVTKNVSEKNLKKKEYYKDHEKMGHLDVYFAHLYFKALIPYLKSKKRVKPWQTYYKYCEHESVFSLLNILIGINAHINTDLCTTLVHENYTIKQDFLAINKILEEVIPSLMKYLFVEEKDIFGFGGIVFKEFTKKEFSRIIVKWRLNTWSNAMKLRKNPKLKKELEFKTEALSKELIKIFQETIPLKPMEFLNRINCLEVNL